ncbi:MAG: helix-turn-helix domain-containing protein [Opitutaceae bacterium]|jgi:transcriptional regulator with XRE-family HTH domain|nr:helix-turn-helix domain-containing protein [Opitutaceae bacterium]
MRTPLSPAGYSAAVAAVLRRRREVAGLSQNRLSEAAGVSRTMLTHVERGLRFPTVDLLCRLARGLETTPARLLAQAERELRQGKTHAFASASTHSRPRRKHAGVPASDGAAAHGARAHGAAR